MSKRSRPLKDKSRLSKRAKVTGLRAFFSVVPVAERLKATTNDSPADPDLVIISSPTTETPPPEAVPSPDESEDLELISISPTTETPPPEAVPSPDESEDLELISISPTTETPPPEAVPAPDESEDLELISISSAKIPEVSAQRESSSSDVSPISQESLSKLISKDAHHPDAKIIPAKKTKTQNICFQQKWFQEYPWLTYDTTIKRVLCHTCSTAEAMKMMNLATKCDSTFQTTGFCNWKKAKQRFESHMVSDSHRHATFVLAAQKQKSIQVHVCHEEENKQRERRHCLKKILRRMRILLRQGLPLRSYPESEGNLYQILQDDAEDDPTLAAYLQQDTNFTSWAIQKEFARDLSHMILRQIAEVIIFTIISII
jgi:hypothetical protein